MGEVYRATDTKLKRQVAIKVLPPSMVADRDRLARFQREAEVLASLNHPNIAAIYGLEEREGITALVMELVEGDDLSERIAAPHRRSPSAHGLPLDEALPIAKQIAEALEAAHEQGIIHRDLKPANIKVRADGTVKVLDYGLAKALAPATASDAAAALANSPTITSPAAMTAAGIILGTAAYMSPEQARGKTVDKRADIWAFGVVLFEMLTGKRAFPGEDITDTLAAVVRSEPDWSLVPGTVSPTLLVFLRRCLQKDPRQRVGDIRDVRLALEGAFETGVSQVKGTATVAVPGGRRAVMAILTAAAVVTIALAIPAVRHLRERPPAPAVPLRFQIPPPPNTSAAPTLSPDGRKVVFQGAGRLWVRLLESEESVDLAVNDVEGVPFWSPDSRFIGYPSSGKLKKIEATGGPPQTVTDLPGNALWGCGAWNQEDVIVFGDRPIGLFRVPASGGVPVQITSNDAARHENSQYCPSFLPDGQHFVYIRSSTDEGKSAIYLGSVDATPDQQSSKALVASNSQPVYAPSADPGIGYLLFVRGDTLMAQPIDNRRLELIGQAAPVGEQVKSRVAGASFVSFSASATNLLAFPRFSRRVSQLTWLDREGKVIGTLGEPGQVGTNAGGIQLSPDGRRVAVTRSIGGGADEGNIWLIDLSREGASTRFTFGARLDTSPVWSPDGSRIIFSSNRVGSFDLYQKPVTGEKDEEVLLKSNEEKHATSWSRDGRFLLYTVNHPRTKGDIWVLPLGRDRRPLPFLTTTFNERQARFSPDGHWVAYTSDESGTDEIYLRSVSTNSAGTAVEVGGKWKISSGEGTTNPRWRSDGHELYYSSRSGRMAVDIETNPTFRAGTPRPIGSPGGAWDSAPDGKRFLTVAATGGVSAYTFVLNWQAGLKP